MTKLKGTSELSQAGASLGRPQAVPLVKEL